jgi:hypothetical protein
MEQHRLRAMASARVLKAAGGRIPLALVPSGVDLRSSRNARVVTPGRRFLLEPTVQRTPVEKRTEDTPCPAEP